MAQKKTTTPKAAKKVAKKAAKPAKIERMTLRYIDRIAPPVQDKFRLGDWLEAGAAYVPGFLEDSSARATSRVQKNTNDGVEVVSVVHQPDDKGNPYIMIDTELVVEDIPLDEKTVGARLDLLHKRVIDVFEACISGKTRAILKPEGK